MTCVHSTENIKIMTVRLMNEVRSILEGHVPIYKEACVHILAS